jgi:spermidine synthase
MTTSRRTLVLLGFSTAVAQAVLLREAMAAIGGSELAWGAVLALWLTGMGLGARAGVRWGGQASARICPAAVLLLAGGGVVVLRAAPAMLGAVGGETLTTGQAVAVWVVATFPAGLAGGLGFPPLTAQLGGSGAGEAYAREALGALAGGVLFSLLLAPLGSVAALWAALAGVSLASLLSTHRILALSLAALCAAAAWPSTTALATATWRWAARPDLLARWSETRHQRLELSTGRPAALYGSGVLLASYPEPYLTVPAAHLAMLLHPLPRRVLAVGTLADGSITAMLRHPLEHLEIVEEDPALLRLLPTWYGQELASALADPRTRVVAREPLRALRAGLPWDLVVLFDHDPTTLRANRTRTLELFTTCRQRMAPDGVLVVRTGVGDTYLGGGGGKLLEILVSTLRAVFPEVAAIPGEGVLLVAGGEHADLTLDPGRIADRWQRRGVVDPLFTPELLPLLLDPGRAAPLQRFVARADAPVNAGARPRAVLLAAGLVEARGHAPLLRLALELESRPPWPLGVVLGLGVALLLGLAAGRRAAGPAVAAVLGFSSLAWWLLLLAVWQTTVGSVYAEVGALSAAFMAGLAGGAFWFGRWREPERRLTPLLAAGVGLSLTLASGVPGLTPRLAVPLLLACGGIVTGAGFAGVVRLCSRGDPRRGAGIAFAADEVGAGVAALVVGLLALPWAGLTATSLGVALLGAAAIPGVLRAR